MPHRDRYPARVPCWVPTTPPDVPAAAELYRGLFGWELENLMPPQAPAAFYEASVDGSAVAGVGSQPEPAASAWLTFIAVDSADEAAERVRAAGGTVTDEPRDL